MALLLRMCRLIASVLLFVVVIPCALLFGTVQFDDSLSEPRSLATIDGYHIIMANHTPRVFSHRGSTNLFPQNTLFAFVNSVEMGADVLDMDARLTKDGHVVLVHDASTYHVTGVDVLVHKSTLTELQQLDFGFMFTANGGRYFPYRGLGIKVLTLREALERLPQSALLNIELKIPEPGFIGSGGALAGATCQLLREYNAVNRVIVMSFSDMTWLRFRRVCPEVATAPGPLGMLPAVLFSSMFGYIPNSRFVVPFSAIQPPASITSRTLVEAARAIGRPVHVWTVNEPTEMQDMMDAKVDGIMSDRLDILLCKARQEGNAVVMDQNFEDIHTGRACDSLVLNHQPFFARMVQAGCHMMKMHTSSAQGNTVEK